MIGALLLSPDAWDQIEDLVTPDDFYRRDHRDVILAIQSLTAQSQPCDVITVGIQVKQSSPAFNVDYLLELVRTHGIAGNIQAYARTVRERSMLRRLIDASSQSIQEALACKGDPLELLDGAEQRVLGIAQLHNRAKPYSDMRTSMKGLYQVLVDRFNSTSFSGLSTGFDELDLLLSGLKGGDLIVVAARPSMGKTALAMNIAAHTSIEKKLPSMVFSLEMSNLQLSMRLVASHARVDGVKLQAGGLDEADWTNVAAAVSDISATPIFIDDSPALTPLNLRSRARQVKRDHGLSLVVVDYIQLMHCGGGKENRNTEVSEITRSLKRLARELDVPVIALSQLNRGVEQRADKRPLMSDLRESGAIEQDADAVLFIYRDEYYNRDSADAGVAEIIIAKQRMGPTGVVKLAFHGSCSRFENLADSYGTF